LFVLLVAGAAIAIGAVGSASGAFSSSTASTCGKVTGSLIGKSRLSGVISAVPVDASCAKADDAARGAPPLIFHGGPVMGATGTSPVVVTPIFWHPAGGPSMSSAYQSLISRYLADVAHDSGSHTNVFSTLDEYFGNNGSINYDVVRGTPINDTNPLPANGCTLNHKDTSGIYADGSGYSACLDDAQVQAETASVIAAHHLPSNFGHIYVLYIPKHVETCFLPGSTSTIRKGFQACTINHEKTAAYCAYHFIFGNTIYANLSYPIYDSPVGFTCGSDARIAFGSIQSPNGNVDADVEISPTSHEIMEAITDPDTVTGWYDQIGYENGDECAYVYGSPLGGSAAAGTAYNQVIHGHHYLTQEEFSNVDFLSTGLGCLQSE
jgi:hypothetical protein